MTAPATPGPSIRLVVPYFGQRPAYLPLVLRSMAANPDVSWLFLTEQSLPDVPPNVAVQLCTFDDLAKRVQGNFAFEISLEHPYKLCDFRPAFGEIFADELAGFDFWGHSDLDVIFGQIRDHLPAAAFQADKILFNGNFSLYRNDAQTVGWYRHEVGKVSYRDAMTNPAAMHFDEWAGIYYIVEDLGAPAWHEDVIFDISFRRYRTRAEATGHPGPHRYAWEGGEICEYRLKRGRLERRTALLDPPAETGAAGTGPRRGRRGSVLDRAERVRRSEPRDAVVGPRRPHPPRPRTAALLPTPRATVGAAPGDPPGGSPRANHRAGLTPVTTLNGTVRRTGAVRLRPSGVGFRKGSYGPRTSLWRRWKGETGRRRSQPGWHQGRDRSAASTRQQRCGATAPMRSPQRPSTAARTARVMPTSTAP